MHRRSRGGDDSTLRSQVRLGGRMLKYNSDVYRYIAIFEVVAPISEKNTEPKHNSISALQV